MLADQTVAELYALRDCLLFGSVAHDRYISNFGNSALHDSTDAALITLRDCLLNRYPVPPQVVTQTQTVQVVQYVQQPLLSSQIIVADQQVLPVTILSALGIKLGSSAKATVQSGKLVSLTVIS